MNEQSINQENITDDVETDYIETINQLKSTTVSKDTYNKLKDEHKKLLNAIVKGEEFTAPATPVDLESEKAALKKSLFSNPHLNNFEYLKNAMRLREIVLETEGKDIFLPLSPSAEDIQNNNLIVEYFNDRLESCNNDSTVLTSQIYNDLPAVPKNKTRG